MLNTIPADKNCSNTYSMVENIVKVLERDYKLIVYKTI